MARVSARGVLVGGVLGVATTYALSIPLMVLATNQLGLMDLPEAEYWAALMKALAPWSFYYLLGLLLGSACGMLGGYVAARIAKHDERFNGALSAWLTMVLQTYNWAVGDSSESVAVYIGYIVSGPALGAFGGYIWERRASKDGLQLMHKSSGEQRGVRSTSPASVQLNDVRLPDQGRRAPGLWAAALVYAWIALGPIPVYFYLRAPGRLPEAQWVGTTPFDEYLGVSLLYHGSAALCFYFLLKRRAHAVWPAAFVALWAGLPAVPQVRLLLLGRPAEPSSWVVLLGVVPLTLVALYVRKLRGQGVLQ